MSESNGVLAVVSEIRDIQRLISERQQELLEVARLQSERAEAMARRAEQMQERAAKGARVFMVFGVVMLPVLLGLLIFLLVKFSHLLFG